MSNRRTFAIVGGGLAGASAAATLREDGFDGRVVLVGSEREEPYNRPPLSKEYLRGEVEEDTLRVNEHSLYRDQEIELRLGVAVASIDAGPREIVLEGGERITFDAALLATGSEPRALSLPGAELAGVHYLRTHPDSDALAASLAKTTRVVIIGGGWIGCEVAASARQLGVEVTLVSPTRLLLENMLGGKLGAFYRDVHHDHGVDLRMENAVTRIEGSGKVERVALADGETVECDLVVAGIGVTPRIELARAAGIEVENGVLVDGHLQSSAPGIFAAGDIANFPHPLYGDRRMRVEHWANAGDQGPFAARAMLGSSTIWQRVPYFFSDQYDVGMEFAGDLEEAERIIVRGDMATREFVAFWLAGDRLVAGMNVNVWDVSDPIQTLISKRTHVEDAALADPAVSLAELAASD
jgi:3-phenylpropionate/trans-cinnamate dioxygenase ferredoxin reductase component